MSGVTKLKYLLDTNSIIYALNGSMQLHSLMVATAIVNDATLLTSDKKLLNLENVVKSMELKQVK